MATLPKERRTFLPPKRSLADNELGMVVYGDTPGMLSDDRIERANCASPTRSASSATHVLGTGVPDNSASAFPIMNGIGSLSSRQSVKHLSQSVPFGSSRLAGLFSTYLYRFTSPAAKPIGSTRIHRPSVGE